MQTKLFSVDLKDALSSAINAVLAAVFVVLYSVVLKENFDVFHTDWAAVGNNIVNGAIIAFVSSIGRRFFTDEHGNIPTPLGTIRIGKKV